MTFTPTSIRRARPLLGTLVDISAQGPSAERAVAAAFAAIARVQRLMSFHARGSDVDRLNRLAQRQLGATRWGPLLDHGVSFVSDA